MINRDLYKTILSQTPIACVDLIIEKDGKFLLGKRNNHPLKGKYYFPGGRILKGETPLMAAKRKMIEETGLRPTRLSFCGYSDGVFKKNEYGLPSVHTISLIFQCHAFKGELKLDSQHKDFKWSWTLPSRPKLHLI